MSPLPPELQPPQPVPMAGAVDLNMFRGSSDQRKMLALQLLQQGNLICPCGERIRDEGIQLFLFSDNVMIPTPNGAQPGMNLDARCYHSHTCPAFINELRMQRGPNDLQPLAARAIPPTQWFDEVAGGEAA